MVLRSFALYVQIEFGQVSPWNRNINLKELKEPIKEQENDIVIFISTKQYINERLIQSVNSFFREGAETHVF